MSRIFPGQIKGGEAPYYYNYFRDYDPSLGRYVQSDPVGLVAGVNTFGYVLQNPINYIDLDGLQTTLSYNLSWIGRQAKKDAEGAAELIKDDAKKGGCILVCYVVGYTKGELQTKGASAVAKKAGYKKAAQFIPIAGQTYTVLSTPESIMKCEQKCEKEEQCD